jgi:mannose-6-phosphate isomerase-like protein (cupin superfamily)
MVQAMPIITGAGRFETGGDEGATWSEQFRNPQLSVGTYSLARGAVDGQSPHTEDEVYVVVSGRASFRDDAGTVSIGPGDTLFVPAGMPHRFLDIEEDLTLVVVFAPPEGSLGSE